MHWEHEGCLFTANPGTSRTKSASESLQEEFRLELEKFQADNESEHASWPSSDPRDEQPLESLKHAGTKPESTCDGSSPHSLNTKVSARHLDVFPGQDSGFISNWRESGFVHPPSSPNEGSECMNDQPEGPLATKVQSLPKQTNYIPSVSLGSCRICSKHQLIFDLVKLPTACWRCLESGSRKELELVLTTSLEALVELRPDIATSSKRDGHQSTDLADFGFNCLEAFLLKQKRRIGRRFKEAQLILQKYSRSTEETVLGLKVLNDLLDLTGQNELMLDELYSCKQNRGPLPSKLQGAMSQALANISFSKMGESKHTSTRTSDPLRHTRYTDKTLDLSHPDQNGYHLGKRQFSYPLVSSTEEEEKACGSTQLTPFTLMGTMNMTSYYF